MAPVCARTGDIHKLGTRGGIQAGDFPPTGAGTQALLPLFHPSLTWARPAVSASLNRTQFEAKFELYPMLQHRKGQK